MHTRVIYVYVYIIYYATTWLFFVLLLFYGYLLYFTRDILSGFLARVWGEALCKFTEWETFPRAFLLFCSINPFNKGQHDIKIAVYMYGNYILGNAQYEHGKGLLISRVGQWNLNYLYPFLKHFIERRLICIPRKKRKFVSRKSNSCCYFITDCLNAFSSIMTIEHHCQKPMIIIKQQKK